MCQELPKEGEHVAGNIVRGNIVVVAEAMEVSPDCPWIGKKFGGRLSAAGTGRS